MAAYDNFAFKDDKEKYDLSDLEARVAALENSSGTGGAKTVFPVGYIFITVNSSTDPNKAFPGTTWERYGAGRMLVGYNTADGDFNMVNKTGGSKNHNHTTGGTALNANQIPSHTHSIAGHEHQVMWNFSSDTGLDIDQYKGLKQDCRIFSEYHQGESFWRLTFRPDKYSREFGNLNVTAVSTASSPMKTGGPIGSDPATGATGAGQSHNHSVVAASSMPPYIVCYMWRRTA